ncbi:MAG: CHRD domain-containing protein [Acidimicrobiales bacterium]|nr:CHRD domain-containing protein [Acidimicrobiales bacterium]
MITATLVAAMMAVSATPASAEEDTGTVFVATIENVSTPETLPTSTGSVAVPLSPGVYVVHKAGRNPLVEPRDAASTALEALAEDGDPSGFPALIQGAKIFNTPVGADAPGPLLPGGKYEFSFTANPGDELSLATMFVQSNDWFYTTVSDVNSIALFDAAGEPLAQDASNQLKLWESKTEVDEEPGTGPNQAPRQSGPNTGPAESGQVISLSSQGKSVDLKGSVLRLTIAPQGMTPPVDPPPTDPGDERPGEPFDAADGMVIGRTGTLNGLNGINVGPDGNVYNASVGGSEITVHDPETGEILDRIGPDQGVGGPDDLFITEDGTIYWTEILAGNVGRLSPDGTVKKQFVGPGVNPITMSDDGRLFVAKDFLGDGLFELDPELEADPIPLIPDIVSLNGFDFGPDGLLYGPLFFFGEIVRIDVDATPPVVETVVSGLNVPSAVKFNSAGELHASEVGGGRILKIDAATGEFEVLAEVEGSIDNLAFDAQDRLFFAAGADNQIVRLTPDGEIDVFGEISLSLPGGVAISPDGIVWVGDLFAMRGYGDGADPVASFYDFFAPPGTAFGGANTVFAYGDLLVTSTTFGNNVQVLNPATGEVLEDYRNIAGPTNAIIHGDRLVASQLGATPGSSGSVVDARSGEIIVDGLVFPVGLASDGDTLYVSDWATGVVTAVTDSGSSVIADGLTGPEGLAVDGDRLLVVEEGLDQLSAIDLESGDVSAVITGLDLGPPVLEGFAPFGSVTGVAVGEDGAIYVTQDNVVNALLKFGGSDSTDPPAAPSVLDVLVADGRFTTLLEVISVSGIEPPPPGALFTLFAPTDEAFAAIPPEALEGLLADPEALLDILLYHLTEGTFSAEQLAGIDEIMTLQGGTIGVEVVDGMVVLNGDVTVIDADIPMAEGIIHAIDAVLQPPQREFLAVLVADFARGSTEVPGPGDPNSLSIAFTEVFELEGGAIQMCFGATTSIAAPTVAHIHRGAAGVSGPVVVDSGFTADSWEQDEFVPRDRFANNCVDVDAALAQEIIEAPGEFYFNVHSDEFPAGANREQLFDAEGLNEFPRAFTAAPLLGSNEVPGPGDPDSGRGFVDFSLPVTDNGEICYRSVVFKVGEITGAHIHAGAAGESGDVVVDLEAGSRWPVVAEPSGLGWIIDGCSPITSDILSQIEADPGAFYANLHNAEFPAGAVRAQLVAGVGEIIRIAELVGETEGDGFANLALFPSQGQLCWGSDANGIDVPTAASILLFDTSVVDLDLATHPFEENQAPWADYTSFGCQAVDAAIQQAIVDTPSNYTVRLDGPGGSVSGDLFDPQFGPGGPPPVEPPPEGVNLQILAINDFHGNIATTSDAFGGVGRADFLAANMATAESEADNSIIVSAGDLIGASPLISALFHDEPTIEAMNLIGLEINGVGNHEFDEGADELLRMQNGGSHPVDGDLDGDGFDGADFEFLAANVVDDASGDTIFAPFTVKTYDGIDVAFIGMTLEGTPTIVTPAGVAGLTFNDEVDTVNALIPELQADGIEAIVVLLHEGGIASEGGGDGDGCGTLSGPLNDIVVGLDDAVDLVIGGHNNQRFACLDVDGKAVTMAYHSGRMFTDIDVVLDIETGDMTVVSIDNKENFQEGVTPAPDLTALIDRYDVLSAPLANQVIGSIVADITEETNDAGESALGDVIADAQLAATSSEGTGAAVVAFMNPGGIRDDFLSADVEGGEAAGEITFGEAFSVQPFGNSLVTMTLTGEQIHTLLTQQWVGQEPGNPRILQVSDGFSYTWDAAAADQDKVDAASIMIDGVAVDPAGEYRITVNSFLADGGDNFAVLVDGTDRLGGEVDLDALVTYFEANSPVPPGPVDRITVVGAAPVQP